jgi:hypothetical protein
MTMPKPYSRDLRERVVGAVEAGASCNEAAATFEVGVSSAIRRFHRRAFLVGTVGSALSIINARGSTTGQRYFPIAALDRLRANPTEITSLYGVEKSRFLRDLGSGFASESEEHVQAGFCGVMAYDLTPYGPEGDSAALPLKELVNRPSMDCDNYIAVTWHLFNLLCPKRTSKVVALGFEGGPFGNHAQMLVHKKGGGSWLIDPTLGVVQCGYDFDWIVSGKPCDPQRLRSFYHPWRDREIISFYQTVLDALAKGHYRPSHLLYYLTDLERFLAPPPREQWFTPSAVP